MRRAFDRYGRSVYTDILERTNDREVARQLTVEVFSDLYSGMQKGKTTDAMELLLKEYTDRRIKWMLYSEKDLSEMSSDMKTDEFGAFADGDGESVIEKIDRENARKLADDLLSSEKDPGEVLKRSAAKDAGKKKGRGAIAVLVIVLALMGAWVILGLLTRFGVIHGLDLGWSWYNAHILHIF